MIFIYIKCALKHWVFHQCVHWWNPGVLKNEHDVVTSCHWSIDQWFLTFYIKRFMIQLAIILRCSPRESAALPMVISSS